MTQEIYISDWLEKDYKDVYNQLHKVLSEFGITPKTLPYSEEVWCRDYMPIHIGEGKYVGFNFQPDYLWDDPKHHKYITRQELAIEDLNINISDNVDIVLDGGNYVRCGDKVVMTDKIFSENPNWRPLALLCRLEEAFQAEIILLPWDMNEPFGHSDGMIAWLGDDRILLNNYHQLEKGKRKSFSTRIRKILNSQFEILELEYKGMLSQDSWCYMNYLETDNAIILPALSMNHDGENDKAALKMFQNVYDNKVIRQVFAQPLIKHGGALHCATWNHYIL